MRAERARLLSSFLLSNISFNGNNCFCLRLRYPFPLVLQWVKFFLDTSNCLTWPLRVSETAGMFSRTFRWKLEKDWWLQLREFVGTLSGHFLKAKNCADILKL